MKRLEIFYNEGRIPEEFREVIPEQCSCGGYYLLNNTMTELSCESNICPEHMALKLESMLKSLKAKDFGPATCYDIVSENGLVHHAQVFTLDIHQMPQRNSYEVQEKLYREIHKVNELPLADIAKLLRARDMQTRCDDIFNGYNDLDTFYTDFKYSEDFIARQLGMGKGILTSKFTKHLTELENVLRGLGKEFKVLKTAQQSMTICCTGEVMTVEGYRSRDTFIKDMQDLARGELNIVPKSSVSGKVDYLITDSPHSGTSKNRRADELGVEKLTFLDFKDKLTKYIEEVSL